MRQKRRRRRRWWRRWRRKGNRPTPRRLTHTHSQTGPDTYGQAQTGSTHTHTGTRRGNHTHTHTGACRGNHTHPATHPGTSRGRYTLRHTHTHRVVSGLAAPAGRRRFARRRHWLAPISADPIGRRPLAYRRRLPRTTNVPSAARTGFYWVSLSGYLLPSNRCPCIHRDHFTGFFYRVFFSSIPSASCPLRVLPVFTRFYRFLPGFTGFHWVSLGFNGFHWVLPSLKTR